MLETERLLLRPCRDEDKAAFASILNTPAMMAHLGGVRPPSVIDALVEKRIADQAKHGFSYWAVELRTTGELVGTCGLRIASNYPGAPVEGLHEMGWRIAERWWGLGLALEAARASLDWAWANTTAPAVAAWTTAGNRASWRIMERLGMSRRPDLDFSAPAHGEPDLPLIVYAMDRPKA